jgi:hypothetical protein
VLDIPVYLRPDLDVLLPLQHSGIFRLQDCSKGLRLEDRVGFGNRGNRLVRPMLIVSAALDENNHYTEQKRAGG